MCILLFFTEYGCGQVFENSIDYEICQLQGCQLSSCNISVMDKVKNAFASQIVWSPELHFANVAKEPTSPGIRINEGSCLCP